MEPSLIASWIAAGVALLALLANIILQIWSFDRRSKHEIKIQERQISFQEQSLAQSAENEYMSWLRDKRLIAMERVQNAFIEVLAVADRWSFKDSIRSDGWSARADAAREECTAALSSLRLVYGLHMDVMEHSNDLAKYSSKICRFVLLPWGQEQQMKSWEDLLEEHKSYREELHHAYLMLWPSMHGLTTPMPKSERWRFDEWMDSPSVSTDK